MTAERPTPVSPRRPVGNRLSRDSRLPFYQQLKEQLLEDIRSRALREGDQLDSEPDLCARFGVSRTVVRQAVGELSQEGYLTRVQGKGTFVSAPKFMEYFLDSADGFHYDFASRGFSVVSKVFSCREEEPTDEVRAALNTREKRVVVLERIRSVDGKPLAFTRSYLPNRLHTNLLKLLDNADLSKESLYSLLRDSCGVSVASAVRRVEAVNADQSLATSLGTAVGAALLLIRSQCRDMDGRPVEYFEAWHRADLAVFEVQVPGRTNSPGERVVPNDLPSPRSHRS
ncbi:MAG: GntR family transcriptional regulator [Dactylosporangium sp.]|nr:GntR family transcriptional regulator [Dactylosporangium sp.]